MTGIGRGKTGEGDLPVSRELCIDSLLATKLLLSTSSSLTSGAGITASCRPPLGKHRRQKPSYGYCMTLYSHPAAPFPPTQADFWYDGCVHIPDESVLTLLLRDHENDREERDLQSPLQPPSFPAPVSSPIPRYCNRTPTDRQRDALQTWVEERKRGTHLVSGL